MILLEPMKLGFSMAGLEEGIASYVKLISTIFEKPTYVEIGVGHGETLVGVAQLLSEINEDWRAIGVELPNGYSFDKAITKQNAVDRRIQLDFMNGVPQGNIVAPWNQITVVLEFSQVVIGSHWIEPIHLLLIDGCHGKECATLDFLCAEPFVPQGGIVMFHDFGREQIGQSQPHCGSLDVRGACDDLGLTRDERHGWKYLCELVGDKTREGANMGVFQRI